MGNYVVEKGISTDRGSYISPSVTGGTQRHGSLSHFHEYWTAWGICHLSNGGGCCLMDGEKGHILITLFLWVVQLILSDFLLHQAAL